MAGDQSTNQSISGLRRAFFLLVALVISGCSTSPVASVGNADPSLAARLDPILLAPGATVGARVIELPSGRELYARSADRPMMPASNLKLVTTATALDLFGPGHTFPTRLAIAGQDLYLIGGGDPGLGDSAIAGWAGKKPLDHFEPFLQALRQRGVTHLSGKLFYDDHAFDDQWTHPSWSPSFREFWYAAPVAGLDFNDNCIDVAVDPTTPSKPVAFDVTPPTSGITIVNHCLTGTQQTPTIHRGPGPTTYILSGTCARKATLASKPIDNPGYFTADALRTYLAKHGVTIDGAIVRLPGRFNNQGEIIATVTTVPIAGLIKRTNKPSQNFFAETLAKQSGEDYRRRHPDFRGTSWEAGGAAASDFFSRHHISAEGFRAVDGSGLSRENRVTARLLTELLATMSTHPAGQAFRDSLPIAGVDGSLKKRLTECKGKVQAKTGSIGKVRALSGYATTDDGRTLVFSLLCNDIEGDEDAAVARMDDAVRAMLK
jgi:D-alanyl-D-alanine carboxypeptidase/D-alanyl-D-alanine-endopeptidase (penicillin-binding protein 4)